MKTVMVMVIGHDGDGGAMGSSCDNEAAGASAIRKGSR